MVLLNMDDGTAIQALCLGTKEILLVRPNICTMNPPIPRPEWPLV